ncbi:MAG: thiol:disulfide interchange protein DsbA/DsbL [Rhodanobacter sp.]
MLKRLPILCVAMLALAACSQSNSGADAASSTPATNTSATTTAVASSTTAAPATTPAAASTAATAPTSDSSPAAASSANAPTEATAPAAAPAAPFVDDGTWVEGKNYVRIEPAQPTNHPDKIEVTEVFSYGCPACNAFHPTVAKIARSLPADAVMNYLPASFIPQENWPMLQRAYLAAQVLGVAIKGNDAMFSAVWDTDQLSAMSPSGRGLKPAAALPTIEDAAKVYAKFGVDPKEFVGVANSFAVNTKMKRADDLIKAYGVTGTPTMVINGKYRFDVGAAGGYTQAIALTKWLVAKEAAGK